ncbi:MAG: hypothetical protein AAF561_03400 [Planctomycetota bacterium]
MPSKWLGVGLTGLLLTNVANAGRIEFQPTSGGHAATATFDGFGGGGFSRFDSQIAQGAMDSGSFAFDTDSTDNTRPPFNTTSFVADGAFSQMTSLQSMSNMTSSGGLFPLQRGPGDRAFIVRPTFLEGNQATFYARLRNNTGTTLDNLTLSFDLLSTNDKSNGFALSTRIAVAADDGGSTATDPEAPNYTALPAAGRVMNDAVTPTAAVSVETVSTPLSIALPDRHSAIVAFSFDPIGSSRAFDAYGLDNISIASQAAVIPEPLACLGGVLLGLVLLRRS